MTHAHWKGTGEVVLNGRRVPGFALGEDLRSTLRALIDETKAFSKMLTPREVVVLRLGLAASHLEESLAQGAWKRAEAHAENVANLLEALRSGR
jgi:hypothetical protein